MRYRVEFKRSAAKALKKVPKPDRMRIRNQIDRLMESVPDPEMTKMKGNNPFHRIRVGDYRVVYEKDEEKSIILVLKIGHRKEVYRHIS